MARVRHILDKCEDLSMVIGGIAVLAITGMMFLSIAGRNLLGGALSGILEISEAFLWVPAYLVTAYVLRLGGHVKIELFTSRLGKGSLSRVEFIDSVIEFIFACILFKLGTDGFVSALVDNRVTEVVEFPEYVVAVAIPVGLFLLVMQTLLSLIQRLRSNK